MQTEKGKTMAEYIDRDKAHIFVADNVLAGIITREEADIIDEFLEACSPADVVERKPEDEVVDMDRQKDNAYRAGYEYGRFDAEVEMERNGTGASTCGEWKEIPHRNDTLWKCLNCGQLQKYTSRFCPNCGALMQTSTNE